MNTSAVQPAADKPATNPAASHSGEESGQNVAPQSEVAESYKTLRLLKEWPLVLYILNKAQEVYESVKHGTKVTETGLGISEKVLSTLTAWSGNIIQKMWPVLQLVDQTASEGVERLQKRFPVVKESPEKIYDTFVERLVKFISPAVNTAVSVTEVGRRQVKKSTKTVFEYSRKVITLVENRLERWEKYMGGTELHTESSGQSPAAQDQRPGSWAGKLQRAARSTLGVAASASLLCVGAACWLLERLPIVGALLAEAPASQAAPSTLSSASSYSSLSDEPAADEDQRSQLPPQLSQATQ